MPWLADTCTIGNAKRRPAREACDKSGATSTSRNGGRLRHFPSSLATLDRARDRLACRPSSSLTCLAQYLRGGGTAGQGQNRQGYIRTKEAEIIMCQRDLDRSLVSCTQVSFDLVGAVAFAGKRRSGCGADRGCSAGQKR